MTAPRKRAPAKKAAAAPRASQRARLLGRPRPSTPYRLLVDVEHVAAARAGLAEAQQQHRRLTVQDRPPKADLAAAKRRLAEAEAAVDHCYEIITVRALPPARVAELEDQHQATDEQLARTRKARDAAKERGEEPPDWPAYADSFWPAVLAESVDNGMTVADWTGFLAERVSDGELRGLQRTVLAVNAQERVADPLVLPKGLTGMLS